MKILYYLFTLTVSFLTLQSCEEDKSDLPPIEQLPAATQEGKNTMGALINGEPFIPGNGLSSPGGFFQFNPDTEKYVLSLSAAQGLSLIHI